MNTVKNSAIASTITAGGYGGAGRQTVGLRRRTRGNRLPAITLAYVLINAVIMLV